MFVWPKWLNIWLNGWVFVYELSRCGFEYSCSHLNFRFRTCFELGVPWHSGCVDSLWNAYVTWQEDTVILCISLFGWHSRTTQWKSPTFENKHWLVWWRSRLDWSDTVYVLIFSHVRDLGVCMAIFFLK